jgi:molybdenum cofactor cytidylyltransferase
MRDVQGGTELDQLVPIILAAGGSTRLGSPKQLVSLHGENLLQLAIKRASAATGREPLVVLGSDATAMSASIRHLPHLAIVNEHWGDGIASSIRAGINRVPPGCLAAMLLLADQPQITSDDLTRLARAWENRPKCIAAAYYSSHLGVPAIFPSRLFQELTQLRGDVGARSLLRRNSGTVTHVDMPSAAIDIDTQEDLLELIGIQDN